MNEINEPLAREVENILYMELIKERGNMAIKLGFSSPSSTPSGIGFIFNDEQREAEGKRVGAQLHEFSKQIEKMDALRKSQIPSQEGEYIQSIEQKEKEDAERKAQKELLEKEGFFGQNTNTQNTK